MAWRPDPVPHKRALMFAPLAAAALASLWGCAASATLPELARQMRDEQVRTLVAEPEFTLVSPFEAKRTATLSGIVATNLLAVTKALEVQLPRPLLVYFRALPPSLELDQTDDSTLTLSGNGERPTQNGVLGFTGRTPTQDPTIVILVAADSESVLAAGRQVMTTFRFDYEPTIRHEIAHVCAELAGLEGPTWFDEGLAIEIESMNVVDGVLTPGARWVTLDVATEIHEQVELRTLLEWEEDADRLTSGEVTAFRPGRPLAHALMRFLLRRVGDGTLRERFERVHSLSPAQILALEPQWRAWIDAQARAGAGSAG